jgi:3-methyladenine DNA glycosylase AlkD
MGRGIGDIVHLFEENGDPEAVRGMAKYGIVSAKVYGVKMPVLRDMARSLGKDHDLAMMLWEEGSREARILASLVDLPEEVTEHQMEGWVGDLDNWEVCDQAIWNLFGFVPMAYDKAIVFSKREPEFEKRAGYVIMAHLAHKNRAMEDSEFEALFPHLRRGATDGRNYVKKAVSWALRKIGGRNLALNRKAIGLCKDIGGSGAKAARWVASDALKELTSERVRRKLEKVKAKKGVRRRGGR